MSTPAVDRDALVDLLDGDPDIIATLIDSFLTDCSDYMDAIREAVDRGDTETLEREAHGLKGAAGSLRASPSSGAAQTLEEMGHTGDLTGAEAALDTLETEIDRLKDELRALRKACQEAAGTLD
ncbi:Hpt domain-containing protein [Salinibacter altiplanensis]|uniref:Hpt domain-containing protein n=1 Tax=Salinibacter altiplanensis TaxID=1803181 RepID=UPI000C9FCB8A|nr:Hpt domain-containing protein [Salinibacter altiplanensis]